MESSAAKIARGVEHFEALKVEMNAWGHLNPIGVGRTVNRDGSEHLFHLRLSPSGDFDRWAIMLGDSVHCFRAALDHAVFALARSIPGNDPPKGIRQLQFPICSDPATFGRQAWHIKTLTAVMRAGIESFQPYRRRHPNGFSALEWLAFLDDVDKHRLNHVMALGLRREGIDNFEVGADDGTFTVELADGGVEEGAPFMRLRLSKPDPNVNVDFHMTTAVVVDGEPTWGNTGVEPLMDHIQGEVLRVHETLALLIPA